MSVVKRGKQKICRNALAILQIIGGVLGLIMIMIGIVQDLNGGAFAADTIIVGMLFLSMIIAGVLLFQGSHVGWWLSFLVQILQLLQFCVRGVEYMFFSPFVVGVSYIYPAKIGYILRFGAWATVARGYDPSYQYLQLNVVALIAIVLLKKCKG